MRNRSTLHEILLKCVTTPKNVKPQLSDVARVTGFSKSYIYEMVEQDELSAHFAKTLIAKSAGAVSREDLLPYVLGY